MQQQSVMQEVQRTVDDCSAIASRALSTACVSLVVAGLPMLAVFIVVTVPCLVV